MSDVLINLTVHARGEMATKLLEAAEELGLSPYVIKTTSEGFRVPREVHAHLFPSQYDDASTEADEPVIDPAADFDEPVIDPAADFDDDLVGSDLTEAELEELTAPDKGA